MSRAPFLLPAMSLLAASVAFPALAWYSQGDRAHTDNEFHFDVLSIKPAQGGLGLGISKPTPNGFSARATLSQAVLFAYGPPCPISVPLCGFTDIRNQPGWFSEPYAFDARVSQADVKAWRNQGSNSGLLRSALRTALRERCKIVLHQEPKQQATIELLIAKGGARLQAADPSATLPTGVALESGGVMTFINNGRGGVNFHGATIQDLVNFLTPLSPRSPPRPDGPDWALRLYVADELAGGQSGSAGLAAP